MNYASNILSRSSATSVATPAITLTQPLKKNNNEFLSRALSVQLKLSGAANDSLEKEADDMADKIMRMPSPEPISFSSSENVINRKCSECDKENELQRKESNSETTSYVPPIVHDVLNSSDGKTLDAGTRSFMEPRFNYDFSDVKIHDNDIAAKSASSLNALAYTSGNNVVFNSGQYNTNSDSGKRLLAHELTHVVQQANSIQKSNLQRFPDDPVPMDDSAKVKPAKSCPAFISLDATVKEESAVSDACKGKCRIELGCCTTERGKCGSSPGSGAVIKAEVEVPKECVGELGFMQNVMTSDRKRTMDDKTKECLSVSDTRADGGVPYKACKLDITAPGKYSIETDDCPYIILDDKMIAASANDSFKTFLIWKVKGGTSWKPIANVEWKWNASTSRIKGADCASNWSKPSGKSSGGSGKASGDVPDRSADIKDEKWGKCAK